MHSVSELTYYSLHLVAIGKVSLVGHHKCQWNQWSQNPRLSSHHCSTTHTHEKDVERERRVDPLTL